MRDPKIEVKIVYSNIFKFTYARKIQGLKRVGCGSNKFGMKID